ncbi:MAG TPA: response regulator [Thermoanaerobaculia bacterium]
MKRRILLADDSVTIQKVIELTFMDEDYEVRAVSNGDEALALLNEINPDFVIADVHMPGANGYEVCRRSKQTRPDIPVLLLVGTFEPFDEGQARSSGADSHLKKPFDSQELLQRVEELLASRPGAAAPAPAAFAAPAPAPAEPDWGFQAPAAAPEWPPAPPPEPVMDWAAPAQPPAQDWNALPTQDWGIPAAPELPLAGAGTSAAIPPEPSWGSFDLEAEPEPPPVFAAPAAPEPFDREVSFNLEPDPTYTVEEEQVFTIEEDTPSFAVRDEVFGAPSELSLDELPPQDRYVAEPVADEPAPVAPAAAGFNWSPEPEPLRFEEPNPAPPPVWNAPVEEAPRWSPPEPEREPEPAAPAAFAAPAPAPPPEPVFAAPVAAAAPAAAANGNGRLSDEDVDRIARRVVELLGDKTVRDVAWEVVPDMAEVIIRDRLRELEAQVE